MKMNSKFPIIILLIFSLFFSVSIAYAEIRNTVKIETNTGGNTVCVNGECKTEGAPSESKSRVCVNGRCQESDGDMSVSSDDGSTKIDIKTENKTSIDTDNNIEVEVKSDTGSEKESEEQKSNNKNGEDKNENTKNEEASKDFKLVEFIKEKLFSLRKIITFQFLFGDK
jgi:hypothetical protein